MAISGNDRSTLDEETEPLGTFASFQAPGYPTLWWGGLFSFLSVQMQMLLRGLLAWDLTERPAALGLVYLAFGVSMLISTPLGGVASDLLPKKRTMLMSQGVISAVAAGMGIVVVAGIAQFWMLLVSAVFQGAAFGFLGPARIAIAREIVGRKYLGNAITLSLLSMNGTRVFAPSLAGVLAGVAALGIGGTYLISAVAAVASWILLLRLPESPPKTTATSDQNGYQPLPSGPDNAANGWRNPFAEILDGVRYVLANRPLRRLVISSFFVVMFGFNYVAFLPALVEGEFGLSETWVGLISSASAIGAVASAGFLAGRADSGQAKTLMIVSGASFGISVVVFGLSPNFWAAFGVVIFVGAAFTIYQSLSNTIALTIADDSHQGRVQSLMMLAFAGFGIAAAPLGRLAEYIGLREAIVVMGAVAAGSSLLYFVLDRLDPQLPKREPPSEGNARRSEGSDAGGRKERSSPMTAK